MAKGSAAAASGGDGSGAADAAAAEVVDQSTLPAIPDASPDQTTLESHIDDVLGLPKAEEKGKTEPDGTDDKPADTPDTTTPDTGEAEEAPAEPETPVEPPEEPEPEKTPASESGLKLEVTDKNGKSFTLKPGDDIDTVLAEFEPKSSAQVMSILEKFGELKQAQAKWDTDQATAAANAEQAKAAQARLASWDAEITALQGEERIGKPTAKPGSPEYLADPAIKRVDQVFKFMMAENERRTAAKNPNLITSFADALDKLELQELKAQQAKDKSVDQDLAKQKSALIGGRPAAGGNVAKPYIAGSAKSIWDLD